MCSLLPVYNERFQLGNANNLKYVTNRKKDSRCDERMRDDYSMGPTSAKVFNRV